MFILVKLTICVFILLTTYKSTFEYYIVIYILYYYYFFFLKLTTPPSDYTINNLILCIKYKNDIVYIPRLICTRSIMTYI